MEKGTEESQVSEHKIVAEISQSIKEGAIEDSTDQAGPSRPFSLVFFSICVLKYSNKSNIESIAHSPKL